MTPVFAGPSLALTSPTWRKSARGPSCISAWKGRNTRTSPPSCRRVRASDSETSARLVRRTRDWSSGVTKAIFKLFLPGESRRCGPPGYLPGARVAVDCTGRGSLALTGVSARARAGKDSETGEALAGPKLENSWRRAHFRNVDNSIRLLGIGNYATAILL